MLERRVVLFSFVGIIILTAIAALLTLLGVFKNADPAFGKWALGGLFAEILAAVVAFLRFRPGTGGIFVNIVLPEGQPLLDIDEAQCTYEIKNGEGDTTNRGKIVPILGPGGYQCRLTSQVQPSDFVRLNIKERNGTGWEVPFFSPYVTNQKAVRRSN